MTAWQPNEHWYAPSPLRRAIADLARLMSAGTTARITIVEETGDVSYEITDQFGGLSREFNGTLWLQQRVSPS